MIVVEDSIAQGHKYLLFLGGSSDFDVEAVSRLATMNPGLFAGKYSVEDTCRSLTLPELSFEMAKRQNVDRILIGIKNCCGQFSAKWQAVLTEALELGFDLVSISPMNWADYALMQAKAEQFGRRLIEIRPPNKSFPVGSGVRRRGHRLLTVGTDCAVGMTYTALAIARELSAKGLANRYYSTGHASNWISDRAVELSAVPGAQLSGAAEWLAPESNEVCWDIIGGHASINHPSYASMTLGLLHGSQPDCLVLCHKAGRKQIMSRRDFDIGDMQSLIDIYLKLGQLTNPTVQFIGISVNTEALPEEGARVYLNELECELGLPATDPSRFGVEPVVDNMPPITPPYKVCVRQSNY